jgi:hypothetical protein
MLIVCLPTRLKSSISHKYRYAAAFGSLHRIPGKIQKNLPEAKKE